MQIKPILSALRRHKAGTILIAMQIALTLAIVCNALFIVHERIALVSRPTGMDERNVIVIQNRYVGSPESFVPQMKTDVQALREVPGVQDAYVTNAYPLRQGGWSTGIRTNPDATKEITEAALYFGDDHTLKTLGTHLIAGRNFNASEVVTMQREQLPGTPQVIVTKAVVDKVFPDGDGLGKTIYLAKGKPSTIIGIVDRLTVPWTDFENVGNVVILPILYDSGYQFFMVRTEPGRQDAVFQSAPKALYTASRMRVLPEKSGVRTFEAVRSRAYESDRGMAILMTIVCGVLLAITAAGIVGLSSFWVGQRRRQIGVRRALGARRSDILGYFMTENFLIALAGVVVGTILALALSQWMFTHFEMRRLSATYVAVGVAMLLVLGQLAVLAPALRASRVSPVEATRGA